MAIIVKQIQESIVETDENVFVTLTVPEGLGFKLENERSVDEETHKKIKEHRDKNNEFVSIQITQPCISEKRNILFHYRFLTFKKPFREDQESAEETHPAVEG